MIIKNASAKISVALSYTRIYTYTYTYIYTHTSLYSITRKNVSAIVLTY